MRLPLYASARSLPRKMRVAPDLRAAQSNLMLTARSGVKLYPTYEPSARALAAVVHAQPSSGVFSHGGMFSNTINSAFAGRPPRGQDIVNDFLRSLKGGQGIASSGWGQLVALYAEQLLPTPHGGFRFPSGQSNSHALRLQAIMLLRQFPAISRFLDDITKTSRIALTKAIKSPDSIILYRGLDLGYDPRSKMRRHVDMRRFNSDLRHNPLSAWSNDPISAKMFAKSRPGMVPVVLRARVPVQCLWYALSAEGEVLVAPTSSTGHEL